MWTFSDFGSVSLLARRSLTPSFNVVEPSDVEVGMNVETEMFDGQRLIPDVLRAAPQVRPVLDHYGLRGCGGPLGPVETLEFFARAHDVTLAQLLEELQQAAQPPMAGDATTPGVADSTIDPTSRLASPWP